MVLLGVLLGSGAGRGWLLAVFLSLSLMILCLIYHKKVWKWYLLFPCFMAVAFFRMEWANEPSALGENLSCEIVGKVNKVVEKDEYRQIYLYQPQVLVSDEDLSGTRQNMTIKGILVQDKNTAQELIPGDVIFCKGVLCDFEKARNPGNFDSYEYYQTLNIDKYVWTEQVEIWKKNENLWIRGIFAFKKMLKDSYRKIGTGADAGIYASIVLGDKSMLDADIRMLYQINGIAHILAISGLHVSILGMGLYQTLRKCCVPFLPCFLICSLLIVSYGIMTGNSISSIRAISMFLLAVFANVLGRTYDILSALAFSASLLILIFPKIIYNSGFWLSFLAVAGIVVIKPVIDYVFWNECQVRKKKITLRIRSPLLSSLSASRSVSIATLPVLLVSYYEVPLYAVFLNLFVLPLMGLLMMSAVCGGIVGIFFLIPGVFFAGAGHYILQFYEIICHFFLNLPNAVLILGKPHLLQILFYYLSLAAACVFAQKSRKKVLFLTVLALFLLMLRFPKDCQIRMLDVGQGDGIHVSSDGWNLFVDGGSSSEKKVGTYRIIPYLKSQGIRKIDFWVMTHADADHINGMTEVFLDGQIKIGCLVMPTIKEKSNQYLEVEEAAQRAKIPIYYIQAGKEFTCGKVKVSCLHPAGDYEFHSENDSSTVLKLSYGEMDMLLTGDIEETGEQSMLSREVLSDVEILKVSHHGSRYSTGPDFLSAVKPEIALISCAQKNSYGHPHKELLERLEEVGTKVFRTDESGAIEIKIEGDEMVVSGYMSQK